LADEEEGKKKERKEKKRKKEREKDRKDLLKKKCYYTKTQTDRPPLPPLWLYL
jgi:hypothetical protein